MTVAIVVALPNAGCGPTLGVIAVGAPGTEVGAGVDDGTIEVDVSADVDGGTAVSAGRARLNTPVALVESRAPTGPSSEDAASVTPGADARGTAWTIAPGRVAVVVGAGDETAAS